MPVAVDSSPALPKDVQEHLGQQLRTEYDVVAEKPAFLGDPVLPHEFDKQLERLETREKVHHRGIEAVEQALEDIILERAAPDPAEDPDRDEP
jgi:hypothetical protein